MEGAAAPKVSAVLIWQIATIAVVVVLGISIVTKGFSFTGAASDELTANQAAIKAVSYINSLLEGQATATLISINETNGLYSIKIDVGGQQYNSYITKDGLLLFPSAYQLPATVPNSTVSNSSSSSSSSGSSYPKTDKPSVELFVMAFCPYGVQAENALKPVVDLLGASADFTVKFIVNVGGTTTDSVQSLHGAPEAMEDLRQVCIRENYNQSTYWSYVSEINANCYSIYHNATVMDACWRAAASTADINASAVESCVNASSVTLIKQDEARADSYSVTGSPTLIINGQRYSGARSSDAFKAAVCSAFNTPPAVCEQALSSSETAASGGCGS